MMQIVIPDLNTTLSYDSTAVTITIDHEKVFIHKRFTIDEFSDLIRQLMTLKQEAYLVQRKYLAAHSQLDPDLHTTGPDYAY